MAGYTYWFTTKMADWIVHFLLLCKAQKDIGLSESLILDVTQ